MHYQASLASRVQIANQVLLGSIWYVASYWSQNLRSINKVKALIRNYIWSRKDGKYNCQAKVAWDSFIQPIKLGGLNLLNPETQINALKAKLFICRLMPDSAP